MKKVICPHCKKPTQWKDNPFHPFCSERCKLIDLGKWASDQYVIPGEKISLENELNVEKDESSSE